MFLVSKSAVYSVRVGPLIYPAAGRLKRIGSRRRGVGLNRPPSSIARRWRRRGATSARFGLAKFEPESVLAINGYTARIISALGVGRLVTMHSGCIVTH